MPYHFWAIRGRLRRGRGEAGTWNVGQLIGKLSPNRIFFAQTEFCRFLLGNEF
jgi:hypothetical protein